MSKIFFKKNNENKSSPKNPTQEFLEKDYRKNSDQDVLEKDFKKNAHQPFCQLLLVASSGPFMKNRLKLWHISEEERCSYHIVYIVHCGF